MGSERNAISPEVHVRLVLQALVRALEHHALVALAEAELLEQLEPVLAPVAELDRVVDHRRADEARDDVAILRVQPRGAHLVSALLPPLLEADLPRFLTQLADLGFGGQDFGVGHSRSHRRIGHCLG